MIRRKREVKRIMLLSIFIISILLTNIQIFNSFYWQIDGKDEIDTLLEKESELQVSSDTYLSDYYITGSGDNQDVRLYVTNESVSYNNQQFFNVPSMSDTDVGYLSFGDFNFTFQNNYTTEYILEDTDALYASSFIDFDFNVGGSSLTINEGNALTLSNIGQLTDVNPDNDIIINASNGIINFSIDASFAGTWFVSGTPSINLAFDRDFILGFVLTLGYEISRDAYITVKMLDISDLIWKNVTDPIFVNSSLGPHQINERIINENLNFINNSDVNQIQFFIERFDTQVYNVTLDSYSEFSTYGFDLPITNNEYVALEFDLKGEASTVNGFYAWIRTLNKTAAASANLNISLYEANRTVVRTDSNLRNVGLGPNNSRMIDSFTTGYLGDELSYFEFNTANTVDLKLYNYFIVIKSDSAEKIYSLVSLPRVTFGDPDQITDHQLKKTTDNGQSWSNARKNVETTIYFSEQLDASSFKINVTRGYMPSDFIMSEDDNLNIQDLPIENQTISSYPYNESSYLTWGLGRWNNNLTVPIISDGFNNFKVDLSWNNSIIKGFEFNVSYSVKAYWIEDALSTYNVSYDGTPEWTLNYTLDLGYKNFDNWDYLEFWFVYPDDYYAHNLTNPNNDEIYDLIVNETGGEFNLADNHSFEVSIVTYNITNNISGLYSLQLNSTNLVYEMHSYLKYNSNFWETNGFMNGDNMTTGLEIRDHNNLAPATGSATVYLFYPKNKTIWKQFNDNSGYLKEGSLFYDFNNDIILNIDDTLPVIGNYYLGYFWSNGSALGCKKLKLYINSYNVSLDDFFYQELQDQNVLDGLVDRVYDNYSILIATVNETTGTYIPNFFPVNESNVNEEYVYEMSMDDIPIVLKSFLQNETILNPNENIIINVSIQNMHELIDLDIYVDIKLVSLSNEEWIIDQQTSSTKTLKLKGDPLGRDIQEFSVQLTMPTLQPDDFWPGQNAPVRKGGAKTIVTIYFESSGEYHEIGIFESDNYALLVNSTESEFEGYIIALKYDKEITGASILKPFQRNECVYLPNQTTFLVNIYDKNYVSSYNQFIDSFALKTNSKFINISINPETPLKGSIFNISGFLSTEFGQILPNENVTCRYYNNTSWINISSQFSDINGLVNFEIDSLTLDNEDQLLFSFIWSGDIYILGKSQNITVDLFRVSNNISISLNKNVPFIYRNKLSTFKLSLTNIGNSILRVIDINVIITPNLEYSIVERNYIILNHFSPNESTYLILEVDIPIINELEINISIDAQNILTDEIINFEASNVFQTFDIPLSSYLTSFFMVIILGVFIIVWGLMYLFTKRTIKRIETPVEEVSKRRPRRGKYVKVSELEKVTEPEEEITIKKKKEKPKETIKEKVTDLDSLLEEEGLKDDKEK
ncbi:MAG: hypothetical protein ACFE85_01875 [Candidatus Hodarchaeota archaeon]